MNDEVDNPKHYQLFADGTQSIDVIRDVLTLEEFMGFCKGNVLKYRLRAGKKDALHQDIAKADTYAKMLAEAIEESRGYAKMLTEVLEESREDDSDYRPEPEIPNHPADLGEKNEAHLLYCNDLLTCPSNVNFPGTSD
jgi:hypothetical protein